MLWLKTAYNWVKDNLLLIGAALGSVITLVVTLLLNRDDSAEILIKHKKVSDENRRKRDEEVIEITERFVDDLAVVREQAKLAGEELSTEQEDALVERLTRFSAAETEEQKVKIAEDIQEVFPFLNMVDPEAFGKVEG